MTFLFFLHNKMTNLLLKEASHNNIFPRDSSLGGQTHASMVMFESSQQPLHSWVARLSNELLVWH
jgi:hypothetical protein